MNTPLIQCPRCRAWLLEGVFNLPDVAPCPACGALLQIEVFPAFFRPMSAGSAGQAVVIEGESACFYHPQKKAVVPCDSCGRFLCALCDCEMRGRHFCPACLEAGRTKGKIKNLDHQRTLYDNIALGVALIPLVLVFSIYFTIITAPVALVLALVFWNKPISIVRRSRIRYWLAVILASAQIIGWIYVLYLFIK